MDRRQIWREVRRLPEWAGSAGARVNQTLFVLLLGVYLPFRMGIEFLDPLVIVPFAFASLVFVSGAAAEAFGSAVLPEPATAASLRPRMIALSLGGGLYAWSILISGVVVVNIGNWYGFPLLPPALTSWTAPLLSLGLSAFGAATALLLFTHHYSVKDVRSRLRGGLFLFLLVWLFHSWLVPIALREKIAPYLTTDKIAAFTFALAVLLLLLSEHRLRTAVKRMQSAETGES